MMVCNNYKYLYTYIKNNYMDIPTLNMKFKALESVVGGNVPGDISNQISQIRDSLSQLYNRVNSLQNASTEGLAGALEGYREKSEDVLVATDRAIKFGSGDKSDFATTSINTKDGIKYLTSNITDGGYKWSIGDNEVMSLSGGVLNVKKLNVGEIIGGNYMNRAAVEALINSRINGSNPTPSGDNNNVGTTAEIPVEYINNLSYNVDVSGITVDF